MLPSFNWCINSLMIEIKSRLKNLIKVRNAVQRGSFTLSSGKESDLYINSKLVSLNPCLVDREEGGKEEIEKHCELISIFARTDFVS